MRFLSTLLLSLCCFAISLQSSAGTNTVKQTQVANEYKVGEAAIPSEALNDYCNITSLLQHSHSSSLQKENIYSPAGYINNNATAYVSSDALQNSRLFFSGQHAKTFIFKLIFPQHYYW